MTPFEVTNPRRRLRSHRHAAIERLSELRQEFPNPRAGSEGHRLVQNAKERVKELQNAKI